MLTHNVEASALFTAKPAGFLYLLVVPLGIFGSLYVPSKLIVHSAARVVADFLLVGAGLGHAVATSNPGR